MDRDARLTFTIFLLCVASAVFVTPLTVTSIVVPHSDKSYIYLVTYLIYWNQYTFNFVIYSASNEQYRRAYFSLLRDITGCMRQKRLWPATRCNPSGFLVGRTTTSGNPRSTWPRIDENATKANKEGRTYVLGVQQELSFADTFSSHVPKSDLSTKKRVSFSFEGLQSLQLPNEDSSNASHYCEGGGDNSLSPTYLYRKRVQTM